MIVQAASRSGRLLGCVEFSIALRIAVDIAIWLRRLGLEHLQSVFSKNEIDLEVLPSLTETDLEKIGLPLGSRKKIVRAIAELAANEDKTQDLPTSVARVERRLLTVFFVDLVGSTELSVSLDLEDTRAVLRCYQGACAEVITRFGGFVAKYLGDGVMGYFGWPSASEDSAEQAVRAGLELVKTVKSLKTPVDVPLAARVGIATGLVVVGDVIGEGASREESVIGKTPNLAARLQAEAGPATVVIDSSTRRLTGKLFRIDDLGHRDLKGFNDPVPIWRVAGEASASRFEALRNVYRTPFISRSHELKVLTTACQDVEAGNGRLIALLGEPGIGKSRLAYALLGSDLPPSWQQQRIECLPYGAATPWLPVIQLVRQYVGIDDGDDQQQASTKLDGALSASGDLTEAVGAPLCSLLGLEVKNPGWLALSPPQRRRSMIAAVKRLLLQASQQGPLALLIEDLQWADSETLATLDSLIEGLAHHRLLLIATYRPEFQHAWGNLGCYQQLRIDQLGADSAAQMMSALLGSDSALRSLKSGVIERAGGNPFFLEELVYDLVERGVIAGEQGAYRLLGTTQQLRLPETVQSILATRIDRLTPESKQLLQKASLIGRKFPRRLLEAVSDLDADQLDRQMAELVAAEMLYEAQVAPELVYAFRHALTHEAAQVGLLRETRRGLHQRIGNAIEELYPRRLEELAESLADHFEKGENWAKAAHHALVAADKAKERYAYPTSFELASRAREIAEKAGDLLGTQVDANVLLGDLASLLDDLKTANQSYDRALALTSDEQIGRCITSKRHEKRIAIRDGARIAYYVHGSGDETLLFMSQIGHGLAAWQPVVERLCQEFRIITVDARGTGASAPLEGTFSSRDHGHDIAEVIRHSGMFPLTAIGISRGGVSAAFSALDHPQLFKKLVFVGTPTGRSRTLLETEQDAIIQGDYERAARLFSQAVISEPETEDLLEQRIRGYLSLPRQTILNFYNSSVMDFERFVTEVGRLELPVLVMHGTEDRRVSFEHANHLFELIPNARLHPFEGRGHLCQVTATKEFCDVLRDFVLQGADRYQ